MLVSGVYFPRHISAVQTTLETRLAAAPSFSVLVGVNGDALVEDALVEALLTLPKEAVFLLTVPWGVSGGPPPTDFTVFLRKQSSRKQS